MNLSKVNQAILFDAMIHGLARASEEDIRDVISKYPPKHLRPFSFDFVEDAEGMFTFNDPNGFISDPLSFRDTSYCLAFIGLAEANDGIKSTSTLKAIMDDVLRVARQIEKDVLEGEEDVSTED